MSFELHRVLLTTGWEILLLPDSITSFAAMGFVFEASRLVIETIRDVDPDFFPGTADEFPGFLAFGAVPLTALSVLSLKTVTRLACDDPLELFVRGRVAASASPVAICATKSPQAAAPSDFAGEGGLMDAVLATTFFSAKLLGCLVSWAYFWAP